ncbi:MAG: dienelactone hydrolase family protein [Burkholderiaceae bacterium]
MADPHAPQLKAPSAPMKRASDFHPEILRLFDRYVHGDISRREFLAGATRFAAAGVSAAAILEALSPRFAQAQQVPPTDARIRGEMIDFDSPKGYGKGRGYLVRPASASGKLPGVLVVHENRGLNPHIEDIARRLALDGFVAFAPDALFTLGGYPGDEDKARALFPKLDQAKTREDFVAATGVLRSHSAVNGRIGVVGFCYGGGIANLLATRVPELRAAVPFYGPAPAVADVPNIKAEMQIHYASNDERINAGWPAYEAALKAAGVRYEAFTYPNTEHGFNNDTTPRYDAQAAKLAWQRTIALFNRTLKG